MRYATTGTDLEKRANYDREVVAILRFQHFAARSARGSDSARDMLRGVFIAMVICRVLLFRLLLEYQLELTGPPPKRLVLDFLGPRQGGKIAWYKLLQLE